jgi:hypothetical protein
MIHKTFQCKICNKIHEISLPENFAQGRTQYPITYVYIHRYESDSDADIENKDKDILTTLYIDANLTIRGVEVSFTEDDTNILSKETSKENNSKLSNTLKKLQTKYKELLKKYNKLLHK